MPYSFHALRSDRHWTGVDLRLRWDLAGAHGVTGAPAEDRWSAWLGWLGQRDVVRIHWTVHWDDDHWEQAPLSSSRAFLELYSWPVDDVTGKPIVWSDVPMSPEPDRSGFISAALGGWRPGKLQMHCDVAALLWYAEATPADFAGDADH